MTRPEIEHAELLIIRFGGTPSNINTIRYAEKYIYWATILLAGRSIELMDLGLGLGLGLGQEVSHPGAMADIFNKQFLPRDAL